MTRRFTTLMLLAMLAIAPTTLRAQSAVFTAEQRNKLAKFMDEHGHKVSLNTNVTTALGITKPGQSLTINQLILDESSTIKHTYMILPNGGFLIAVDDLAAPASYVYRLDANFMLIAGVKGIPSSVAAIPTSDAKRAVDVENNYRVTKVFNKH